jgi:hypothetical protein
MFTFSGKALGNLIVPSSKSGSSFHNSPTKLGKSKEDLEVVPKQSTERDKTKGGWVEAVKMPVPTWGAVVEKINARPDLSSSSDASPSPKSDKHPELKTKMSAS